MRSVTTLREPLCGLPPETSPEVTLLDLVRAVSEEAATEAEVVATVLHILATGRARLCGNFRHASLQDLLRG